MRTLDLPAQLVETLERHRRALGAIPHRERLVFANSRGRALGYTNLVARHWKPLVEEIGIKGGPYILRHTHATVLFEAGADLTDVADRLGHKSSTFTRDTYVTVTPNRRRDVVARLEGLGG